MNPLLEILYESNELVAINKPHGLLVHQTPIARDATQFAVQLLRDQIGQRVYPVHRLDRKTSGVLLFAKSKSINGHLGRLFRDQKVRKTYLAIVRGYIPEKGFIDYPLEVEQQTRNAQTEYLRLQQFEIPLPSGQFPTSRYSLVELHPLTGRHHQLRRHLAHIRHPIIGDRPHGCNKQNKLWKEHFGMTTMLLHAAQLDFSFPEGQAVSILAPLSPQFQAALQFLQTASDTLFKKDTQD